MTSTGAKSSHWLANYYLRGGIALAAGIVALLLGAKHGIPLLVMVVTWVVLWLVAKTVAPQPGSDRQP